MTLDEVYNTYKDTISNIYDAQKINISFISKEDFIKLVSSIIYKESSGVPDTTGDNGCSYGLMQLNYCAGTPQRFGFEGDPNVLYDEYTNIWYGVKYLSYLLKRYNNIQTAVSAYNAGEGRIGINIASYVQPVLDFFNSLSDKKKFS